MTLAEFAAATGGKTDLDVQGHIHAGLRSAPTTKTYRRWFDKRLADLQAQRDATRAAYKAAVAAGEIQAPKKQTTEEIAMGSGERAEAARRCLEKRAARRAALR